MLIRHLVLLFIFAGAGAAVALFLPQWLPTVNNTLALLAGLGAFLVLGLVAEAAGRTQVTGRQGRELAALQASHGELENELKWTRREVKAVREALEAAAYSGRLTKGPEAVDEIMQEVTVLKAQISRLSTPDEPAAYDTGHRRRKDDLEESSAPTEVPLDSVPSPAPPADDPPPLRISAEDRAPLSEGMALVQKVRSAARQALPSVDSGQLLRAVRSALKEDRIEFVLQPIVSLPQRKHRAYECFSRLKTQDGEQLLPEQYIPVAAEAGLIAAIDNILLLRCIQLVRRVQQRERHFQFFCNLSSHTLNDESFFGDLVGFLEANAELAPRLVFEFSQADFESHGPGEIKRVRRLASLGCRLSVDQIEHLDLDAAELAGRNIRYIKLDAADLLEQHDREEEGEPQALTRLKASLDRHRIDLIVEKVEDEASLVELLDYRIDYGQGYLFGEPRPARMAA